MFTEPTPGQPPWCRRHCSRPRTQGFFPRAGSCLRVSRARIAVRGRIPFEARGQLDVHVSRYAAQALPQCCGDGQGREAGGQVDDLTVGGRRGGAGRTAAQVLLHLPAVLPRQLATDEVAMLEG
jgi:hypothetical protein